MIFMKILIHRNLEKTQSTNCVDDMVAYMLKEFLQVVTELFIAAKKSNIPLISLYSNILLFQKIYANLNTLSYHGNPKFM